MDALARIAYEALVLPDDGDLRFNRMVDLLVSRPLTDINKGRIDDYITFLTWYAPPNCFGSRAKFEAWIEDAAERRAFKGEK